MHTRQHYNREYLKLKRYSDGTIKLFSKVQPTYDYEIERRRHKVATVSASKESAKRSKAIVLDLCRNNDWSFFLTLTFGIQDRLNDTAVKTAWSHWRYNFRRKFPDAYYVAVPEYHKKGGLHIHMVIGGITSEELKLVDSGKVSCSWLPAGCCSLDYYERHKNTHKLKYTDGIKIYNVKAWKLGHSTATYVQSPTAVENYIAKYINKGGIDPRFTNNKRYWCSKNIERPELHRQDYSLFDYASQKLEDKYDLIRSYRNKDMAFTIYDFSYRDKTSKLRSILENLKEEQY